MLSQNLNFKLHLSYDTELQIMNVRCFFWIIFTYLGLISSQKMTMMRSVTSRMLRWTETGKLCWDTWFFFTCVWLPCLFDESGSALWFSCVLWCRYVVSVGWDKRINIYSDSVTDVNIHHVQNPNPNWSDDLVCISFCRAPKGS